MADITAIVAPRIFDGETWHDEAAIVMAGGAVEAIIPQDQASVIDDVTVVEEGFLAPGFVDLQVNGGGGVMFNQSPDLDGIRAITKAHARCGTTALLVTLISDTRETTAKAILAAAQAERAHVPGFLGLHLEGPHFCETRKGAHSAAMLRAMDDADLALYGEAAKALRLVKITLAPDIVPPKDIATLRGLGIHISLGHSDCNFATAMNAFAAGASLVTHLFNAMSPLGHREPGLVGAALRSDAAWVGLIADGHHVTADAIAIALRAKEGPAHLFLVSDAMATIGTSDTSFMLGERTVLRQDGRLTLEDGTLAGADIDMADAVRFMHFKVGLDLGEALRMATLYPALAVGKEAECGRLEPGMRADIVHLDSELRIDGVWSGASLVEGSQRNG